MCEVDFNEIDPSENWDPVALRMLKADPSISSRFSSLNLSEEKTPAFDPIKVRNLLRDEHKEGRYPTHLILGKVQMASFRHFIRRGFGEESGAPGADHYFMGLTVDESLNISQISFQDDQEFADDDHHAA